MLSFAAARGKIIRFEVDDTHPDLWAILETLPLTSSDRDVWLFADDPA